MTFQVFPEAASTYAARVDPLFYFLTAFVLAFTVIVLAVVVYLGIKYRKKDGENRRSYHPNAFKLEVAWTIVLVIIAMCIFVWGAGLFYDAYNVPDDPIEIKVVGKQWMWKIRHENGKREVNTLHVPVNQPVKLTMTSQDVIHSFFVPAFRLKQDVLPARYTTLWFEATKMGEFKLFCAEYCGTQHSTMVGKVIVLSEPEYADWLRDNKNLSPEQQGAQLFERLGCASCHLAGDMNRGPSLVGLYGTQQTLAGGATVTVDEEYLRESIVNPGAKVTEGYQALMPAYENQIEEDDLASLIDYIKALQSGE
ncbi:MAG: cytochrome c oxidase subunit II [Candidatus Hydrogenedentota bacterium]